MDERIKIGGMDYILTKQERIFIEKVSRAIDWNQIELFEFYLNFFDRDPGWEPKEDDILFIQEEYYKERLSGLKIAVKLCQLTMDERYGNTEWAKHFLNELPVMTERCISQLQYLLKRYRSFSSWNSRFNSSAQIYLECIELIEFFRLVQSNRGEIASVNLWLQFVPTLFETFKIGKGSPHTSYADQLILFSSLLTGELLAKLDEEEEINWIKMCVNKQYISYFSPILSLSMATELAKCNSEELEIMPAKIAEYSFSRDVLFEIRRAISTNGLFRSWSESRSKYGKKRLVLLIFEFLSAFEMGQLQFLDQIILVICDLCDGDTNLAEKVHQQYPEVFFEIVEYSKSLFSIHPLIYLKVLGALFYPNIVVPENLDFAYISQEETEIPKECVSGNQQDNIVHCVRPFTAKIVPISLSFTVHPENTGKYFSLSKYSFVKWDIQLSFNDFVSRILFHLCNNQEQQMVQNISKYNEFVIATMESMSKVLELELWKPSAQHLDMVSNLCRRLSVMKHENSSALSKCIDCLFHLYKSESLDAIPFISRSGLFGNPLSEESYSIIRKQRESSVGVYPVTRSILSGLKELWLDAQDHAFAFQMNDQIPRDFLDLLSKLLSIFIDEILNSYGKWKFESTLEKYSVESLIWEVASLIISDFSYLRSFISSESTEAFGFAEAMGELQRRFLKEFSQAAILQLSDFMANVPNLLALTGKTDLKEGRSLCNTIENFLETTQQYFISQTSVTRGKPSNLDKVFASKLYGYLFELCKLPGHSGIVMRSYRIICQLLYRSNSLLQQPENFVGSEMRSTFLSPLEGKFMEEITIPILYALSLSFSDAVSFWGFGIDKLEIINVILKYAKDSHPKIILISMHCLSKIIGTDISISDTAAIKIVDSIFELHAHLAATDDADSNKRFSMGLCLRIISSLLLKINSVSFKNHVMQKSNTFQFFDLSRKTYEIFPSSSDNTANEYGSELLEKSQIKLDLFIISLWNSEFDFSVTDGCTINYSLKHFHSDYPESRRKVRFINQSLFDRASFIRVIQEWAFFVALIMESPNLASQKPPINTHNLIKEICSNGILHFVREKTYENLFNIVSHLISLDTLDNCLLDDDILCLANAFHDPESSRFNVKENAYFIGITKVMVKFLEKYGRKMNERSHRLCIEIVASCLKISLRASRSEIIVILQLFSNLALQLKKLGIPKLPLKNFDETEILNTLVGYNDPANWSYKTALLLAFCSMADCSFYQEDISSSDCLASLLSPSVLQNFIKHDEDDSVLHLILQLMTSLAKNIGDDRTIYFILNALQSIECEITRLLDMDLEARMPLVEAIGKLYYQLALNYSTWKKHRKNIETLLLETSLSTINDLVLHIYSKGIRGLEAQTERHIWKTIRYFLSSVYVMTYSWQPFQVSSIEWDNQSPILKPTLKLMEKNCGSSFGTFNFLMAFSKNRYSDENSPKDRDESLHIFEISSTIYASQLAYSFELDLPNQKFGQNALIEFGGEFIVAMLSFLDILELENDTASDGLRDFFSGLRRFVEIQIERNEVLNEI